MISSTTTSSPGSSTVRLHNQTSPLPLHKKPANIGGGASTGYKSTAFTPAAYREAFKVLDPDGDGELTTEELLRGLEIAGQTNVTEEEVGNMLVYADRCSAMVRAQYPLPVLPCASLCLWL